MWVRQGSRVGESERIPLTCGPCISMPGEHEKRDAWETVKQKQKEGDPSIYDIMSVQGYTRLQVLHGYLYSRYRIVKLCLLQCVFLSCGHCTRLACRKPILLVVPATDHRVTRTVWRMAFRPLTYRGGHYIE